MGSAHYGLAARAVVLFNQNNETSIPIICIAMPFAGWLYSFQSDTTDKPEHEPMRTVSEALKDELID